MINEFRLIRKSWRVVFLSTYHPVADLDLYMKNYNELSKRFFITVRELRPADDMKPKYIPWASTKAILEDVPENKLTLFAPDGTLHDSCLALDRAGK